MNKKLTWLLLTLAFISYVPCFSPIGAQTEASFAPIPPYDRGMPSQPFGQTHAYTVTVRGNEEAIVSMKTIFTNYEEATMSAMTFQVPKGEIMNISAYQAVHEPYCIQYESYPLDQMRDSTVNDAGLQLRMDINKEPKCIQYSEPDYYNYYGNTKYMKAKVVMDEGTIMVELAKGIDPQQSGSVVLYYRTTGLIKKDTFGALTYSFETLKVDTTIRSLSVGINTDAELYLEGTQQEVNYDAIQTAAPMMTRDAAMKPGSFVSAEFDAYYQQIGYGRITKTATDLQPFDSFTVEGRYAKSRYHLYGKRIIVGGLLFLGLLLIVGALVYRLLHSFTKPTITATSKAAGRPQAGSAFMMLGLALLSSIISAVYTVGLYVFFTVIERSYYSQLNVIIMLFAMLISCVLYILFIFGPALLVGWKRGVWWGVGTVGITILLLCIYVSCFILYVFLAGQQQYAGPGTWRAAPASSVDIGVMK